MVFGSLRCSALLGSSLPRILPVSWPQVTVIAVKHILDSSLETDEPSTATIVPFGVTLQKLRCLQMHFITPTVPRRTICGGLGQMKPSSTHLQKDLRVQL